MNNLEHIESETKRNLQYQVEKLEKENAILKTKLNNANEEYRSAVKIWEKQTKELQQKVDGEVDQNRKLHEDLVDAYSQVHALNQDLLNAKAQIPSVPEKTTVENKTPQKTPPAVIQSVAEIKQLKEQLNEAQQKLKSLQEKMDIANKSSEQYLSMCRDLEIKVKEQAEINKQLQVSMNSALTSSKDAEISLEKNLENMEKTNRELIEENMKLSQDSDYKVDELQKKINEICKSIEDYKNEAEIAKKISDQARSDCQNQMKLMEEVQEKYERELMLHAQDMQTMTSLKEDHQTCSEKFDKWKEEAKVANQALKESRESWTQQKGILVKEAEALKQRLSDLETCNQNLHEQLDLMGTQMAALQSKNWDETPCASKQSDLKDTQHLLQVIQFIKKEREIASTQYDFVQSENVRLNLKLEQLTSELTEAKAELKDVLGNFQAKAASDAQHSELLKKVEMMNLLSESNNLLRMEKEYLSAAKSRLETQVHELEEKLQPLIEKERQLSQQNNMIAAENNALRVEIKSWQSRTNQLLEQSHRIGPQEYKNKVREIEELKNQKMRLAEELQKKQAGVSQITSNNNALKKEIESLKNGLEEKNTEIGKLNKKIDEYNKTLLQIRKIGRKYKAQFDELKVKYDALETKSKTVESTNQEQVLQEMQKKVEESEKNIKELKEEIKKEKELANVSKQAQSTASEKEERAIMLLTHFRQRFAQVNNQKEALSEENKNMLNERDDLKNQIIRLMVSREEYNETISRLEKELRNAVELHNSEKNYLQKQYEESYQKANLVGLTLPLKEAKIIIEKLPDYVIQRCTSSLPLKLTSETSAKAKGGNSRILLKMASGDFQVGDTVQAKMKNCKTANNFSMSSMKGAHKSTQKRIQRKRHLYNSNGDSSDYFQSKSHKVRDYSPLHPSPQYRAFYSQNVLKNSEEVHASKFKFGFIGLGTMGKKIVKHLLETGHNITVWNRTVSECDPFLEMGAKKALCPADLIVDCDITFCCVSDPEASKSIVFNMNGVVEGLKKTTSSGKIFKGFVEMTSIDPATSQGIKETVMASYGVYLEAPLCGTSKDAEDGTLLILAAGSRELFTKCESCFHAIAKNAYYVSSYVGAGSQVNVIFNSLFGVVNSALAESMALVEQLKLREPFIECLRNGPLSSESILEKTQKMANLDFQKVTALKYIKKDIGFSLLLGNTYARYMPVTAAANEVYKHGRLSDYSDLDMSAVYKVVNH